jgi:hypothetical protein
LDYSYLKASIGSSWEAFWAGQRPKAVPTIKEKVVARIIENQETLTVQRAKRVIRMDVPLPNIIPAMPPINDIKIDSIRN